MNPRLNPQLLSGIFPATIAAGVLRVVMWATEFAGEITGLVVTDQAGAAANASNFATFAAEVGSTPRVSSSFTTATTGLTAATPRRGTNSTTDANRRFVAGEPVALNITKTGTGVATAVNLAAVIELVQSGHSTAS